MHKPAVMNTPQIQPIIGFRPVHLKSPFLLLLAVFLPAASGTCAVESSTTPTLLWETKTPHISPHHPDPEPVTDLSFSADAKLLAAAHGGFASNVLIMDPSTGQVIKTLENKPNTNTFGLFAVDFSSDGRFLAAGASNGRVTAWDTRNWAVVAKWNVLGEVVWDVEFSPDGKTLAAGTFEGVTIWRAGDWTLLQKTPGNISGRHIAYSPDGKLLAANNGATVLSAEKLELLPQVSRNGNAVVDFTSSGLLLSTPGTEPMVGLWDVGKRTEVLSMGNYRGPDQKQKGFTANVVAAGFDDKTVARGEHDGTYDGGPGYVTLFRTNHPFRLPVFGSGDDGLDAGPRGFTGTRFLDPTARGAVLLEDGKTLVVAKWGQPGTTCMYFWNIENGELLRKLPLAEKRQTYSVAIARDGKTIAHSAGGDVELINPETGDVTKTIKTIGGAFNLRFLENGTFLLAGHSIFNLQGREMASDVTRDNGAEVGLADQSHLIAAVGDGAVDIWNTSLLHKIKQVSLGAPSGRVVPAISPNGHWLVTGYERKSNPSLDALQIYDLESDEVTTTILLPQNGYSSSVAKCVFAPDSSVVAISSMHEVCLIDPVTTKVVARWPFSEIEIAALTFLPDSKSLLITATDGTTRKFPIDFRTTAQKWTAHAGNVEAIAFHPTDNVLITSGNDGVIRAWKF